VARLVEKARGRVETILVDTTGYIVGPEAAALKQEKIDRIRPDGVILFQQENEAEHIVAGRAEGACWRLISLRRPAAARTLSREARKRRRQERFARYFERAQAHQVDLSVKTLSGAGHAYWEGRGDLRDLLSRLAAHPGLLCGLVDQQEELVGLGLLTATDIARSQGVVLSPLDPSRYATLQLGLVVLGADGEEREYLGEP